jgi:hypothetical protein
MKRPFVFSCCRAFGAIVLALGFAISARAEFTVKSEGKAPPKELPSAISSLLDSATVQLVKDGKPAIDLWWIKEIALKSLPASPDAGLKTMRETTLVGAAVVHSAQRDYKNNDIAPGVYTMRFALQPQDGDHLGTALFPYFVVLIPAKLDLTPDGINAYRPMVKASGKETSTGHPMVLSLRPMSKSVEGLPKLTEPQAEHRAVQVKVSGKAPDAEELSPLFFELVYEGHGEIQ